MDDFQTFDGLTMPCPLLTDISLLDPDYALVFSLFDPSRLNGVVKADGSQAADVWLDDFAIFAMSAGDGNPYDPTTSDNIFITYELRFCHSSCSEIHTLSFGWKKTKVYLKFVYFIALPLLLRQL